MSSGSSGDGGAKWQAEPAAAKGDKPAAKPHAELTDDDVLSALGTDSAPPGAARPQAKQKAKQQAKSVAAADIQAAKYQEAQQARVAEARRMRSQMAAPEHAYPFLTKYARLTQVIVILLTIGILLSSLATVVPATIVLATAALSASGSADAIEGSVSILLLIAGIIAALIPPTLFYLVASALIDAGRCLVDIERNTRS